MKKIERVSVRRGYDLWSESYDETPNPVVSLDSRLTLERLAPEAGEMILDAGCGTGRNLKPLVERGSLAVGIDFSPGMLAVARRKFKDVPLVLADLERPLPFEPSSFDGVLCALIGEHLTELPAALREMHRALKAGGRLVFSVYHPRMAAAGIEANFERAGVEYRLGACRYSVADYTALVEAAGFTRPAAEEFPGDEELIKSVPSATKYLGFPVLLILEARKPA